MSEYIIKNIESDQFLSIGEIKENTIYILSIKGPRDEDIESFTSESFDFYKYIRQNKKDVNIELYSKSNENNVLILHSNEIWLPLLYFVIQDISLPLIINYVYDYLKFKYGSISKPNDVIHFHAIAEDRKSGKKKEIKYDGPAHVFKDKFQKIDLTEIIGD